MQRMKASGRRNGVDMVVECVKQDGIVTIFVNGEEDLNVDMKIACMIMEENDRIREYRSLFACNDDFIHHLDY